MANLDESSSTLRGLKKARASPEMTIQIMGILNATADSFSGDGVLVADNPTERTLTIARSFIDEGADIIDVGAVPTFPGAPAVEECEEVRRVSSAFAALRKNLPFRYSVDTATPAVAAEAVKFGVGLINSAWGLKRPDGSANTELARIAAEADCELAITHNKATASAVGSFGAHVPKAQYDNLLDDILGDLKRQIDWALDAGVHEEKIFVDPGLGLGKTPEQNLELMGRIDAFVAFWPKTMLAASRKSFLGYVTGDKPADRDAATFAITAMGVQAGVTLHRVHNVPGNRRAADIAQAIKERRS